MFSQLEAPKTVKKIKATPTPAKYVWRPRHLETVIFFDETDNCFKQGLYVNTWNNLRNLRDEHDNRLGSYFEASPFHNETDEQGVPVFRARVIDIATGMGQWADMSLIGECNMANIEWAHSQNVDLRQQAAVERLAAFGEVEAVA